MRIATANLATALVTAPAADADPAPYVTYLLYLYLGWELTLGTALSVEHPNLDSRTLSTT
jgi:hypothetical protein